MYATQLQALFDEPVPETDDARELLRPKRLHRATELMACEGSIPLSECRLCRLRVLFPTGRR